MTKEVSLNGVSIFSDMKTGIIFSNQIGRFLLIVLPVHASLKTEGVRDMPHAKITVQDSRELKSAPYLSSTKTQIFSGP